MKLIIIAPSGGGKGSLAEYIVRDFGIPSISTGDIFRKNIAEKTELGVKAAEYVNKGLWVPDDITIGMLLERLGQSDCAGGYIIDGFPRTLNQAKALSKSVDVDVVIELDLADDIIMNRLAGRWICRQCNKIHNTRWEGFDATKGCQDCGTELYQREDDKPEMIAKRLRQYREQNKEILDFYRKAGKLFTVQVGAEDMPVDTYNVVQKFFEENSLS